MPSIDMPLDKLKHYMGTNPLPPDFDHVWDELVTKAYEVPLSYDIYSTDINGFQTCEFLELSFIGISGSKRYAKVLKPKSDTLVPLMLQFHGYPGSSRSYFEQASWAGLGMGVIALDCPGQGGKGDDDGHYHGTTVAGHIVAGLDGDVIDMYYVKLFQDICILCRIVSEFDWIDADQIYANGASQGAALALVCTALNPIIKKCGALYPFLSDYKRVWEMDLDQVAYEGLRYYSKWFDPMMLRVDEVFEKLGYIDVQHFAKMIDAPVLFGTGLMDTICPPSTQFAVYNKIKSEKRHIIFPDYTHEEIGVFDDLLINFFSEEEIDDADD